jgi:hypothetical protein
MPFAGVSDPADRPNADAFRESQGPPHALAFGRVERLEDLVRLPLRESDAVLNTDSDDKSGTQEVD